MEHQQAEIKLTHKYMKLIENKYILYSTYVIGKGSFGKVIYAKDINGNDLCFKFEKSSDHKNNSILKEEFKVYLKIKGFGVPRILAFGSFKSNRYLIMELLGPSLDKLFVLCDKKFELDTSIYLGIEMINRIEHIHKRGIIHRDIKPNNFMFGKFDSETGCNGETVYIIDFGLSTSYIEPYNEDDLSEFQPDSVFVPVYSIKNENLTISSKINHFSSIFNENKNAPLPSNFNTVEVDARNQEVGTIAYHKHVTFKEGSRFVGTPRYASLNTHLGCKQSRRDDIESIAYILIYFITGDLPWQGVKAKTKSEKKQKIKELKLGLSIDTEQSFCSLPAEIKEFLKITRNLDFYESPDYDKLRGLLISLRTRYGYTESPAIFEWDELLMQGAYIDMKKKYKTLYEGYPAISFGNYLEIIEKKKNRSYAQQAVNNDSNEPSFFENTTASDALSRNHVRHHKSKNYINTILANKNFEKSNNITEPTFHLKQSNEDVERHSKLFRVTHFHEEKLAKTDLCLLGKKTVTQSNHFNKVANHNVQDSQGGTHSK